jgi:hypothetical protein
LAFHAFTGSDVTGRFSGKTKDSCFGIFLQLDEADLSCLIDLYDAPLQPCSFINLQKLLCRLYKCKNIDKVDELRWFLYSNKGCKAEELPPTLGAFKQHVMRANYVAHLWSRSTKNITTLNPIEYGWSLDSAGNYKAIMTTENPAPIAIIELIKCGCKKGCVGRCSCVKNEINCSELCACNAECTNNSNKMDDGVFAENEDSEF